MASQPTEKLLTPHTSSTFVSHRPARARAASWHSAMAPFSFHPHLARWESCCLHLQNVSIPPLPVLIQGPMPGPQGTSLPQALLPPAPAACAPHAAGGSQLNRGRSCPSQSPDLHGLLVHRGDKPKAQEQPVWPSTVCPIISDLSSSHPRTLPHLFPSAATWPPLDPGASRHAVRPQKSASQHEGACSLHSVGCYLPRRPAGTASPVPLP